MRRLAIAVSIIVFVISIPVHAKPQSQSETIEQLVNEVAEAYESKTLGKLDARKPYVGKIKIIIQHSLSNGPGEYVVKWVKSFGQAEAWLKSLEFGEWPVRGTKPLIKCSKGSCTYDFDGGIVHKTLYLKKITYGVRKGRPYIKTILLLDGD